MKELELFVAKENIAVRKTRWPVHRPEQKVLVNVSTRYARAPKTIKRIPLTSRAIAMAFNVRSCCTCIGDGSSGGTDNLASVTCGIVCPCVHMMKTMNGETCDYIHCSAVLKCE